MCHNSKATRFALVIVPAIAAIMLSACAALEPIDNNGPRSNIPPYPIVLSQETTRLAEASLAWRRLSRKYGLPRQTPANLQPLTATMQGLPDNLGTSIVLPKVGVGLTPTEEETRESLRRFIVEWRFLIGADPSQLSLTERTDEQSGIRLAHYEQHPFRYPLRGGFGNLDIRFRSDRQVIGLSSNCIPNTDRLQAALGSLTPKVTWEQAAAMVKDRPLTVTDSAGRQQTLTLSANQPVEVRQLVVYVMPSKGAETLELHLAWEIDINNASIKTIYLDAISEEVVTAVS
jgi:hypothetical protein